MFSYEIGKAFKNAFFYRTPPVAASVLLQQNNWIFNVIMITLGYNQNCHRNTLIIITPLYKISISYQKYDHLVQKVYRLFLQSPNIVSLSETDCPIYQEEN